MDTKRSPIRAWNIPILASIILTNETNTISNVPPFFFERLQRLGKFQQFSSLKTIRNTNRSYRESSPTVQSRVLSRTEPKMLQNRDIEKKPSRLTKTEHALNCRWENLSKRHVPTPSKPPVSLFSLVPSHPICLYEVSPFLASISKNHLFVEFSNKLPFTPPSFRSLAATHGPARLYG